MNVVGTVAGFQANPKKIHLHVVKIVFKYLQGTQYYGLWYHKDENLSLHGYTNVDWVGNIDHPKSTSGGAFYLGPLLVSWFNKKQSSITLSIGEEEYIFYGC